MLNSWLSSRSSRHRKTSSNFPLAQDHVQLGPADVSSVSQSTVGPPGINLTSASDIHEVHAHINDPSVHARTPSLIHSTEKDAGTVRTSDVPAGLDTTPQRVSAPEDTLFTPQDAILAQVFGKSAPPVTDPVHVTPPPHSNAPQPSVSLTTRTSDSVPTPPSIPTSRTRPGPTVTIFDPFSGAKLGEHTPISPSTATPGDASASVSVPAPLPTADDRKLWSSLERILELQAEIAAMHADMEGVGRGWGSNTHASGIASTGEGSARTRKRSLRRGQTLPVGDEEPEEPEQEGGTTGGAISEASTVHSDGEDDDEDDEDEDDIHAYGKRRRDEEFARLAEQFAQRKTAIGGIMNKLDALSTALKTFHTLPPPLFDLAASLSRTDTMSTIPSNISVASSPPPLHLYPGRPTFLPSSVSPSQAGNPVTPPMRSPPPVPPTSTLAPLVSSRDPRAQSPPMLAPIVAPVLPQMALPTIILGSPHVESPADMRHTQSIVRGVR